MDERPHRQKKLRAETLEVTNPNINMVFGIDDSGGGNIPEAIQLQEVTTASPASPASQGPRTPHKRGTRTRWTPTQKTMPEFQGARTVG